MRRILRQLAEEDFGALVQYLDASRSGRRRQSDRQPVK
jgi:hypothetical protein